MKTRYAIIEPGPAIETDEPIEISRLATLEWIEVEFKEEKPGKTGFPRGDARGDGMPTYKQLDAVLSPLFGQWDSWERVAVNSFKGPSNMFVVDDGAGRLPVNQLATLVYWTATILHEIDRAAGPRLPTYAEMRNAALLEAADRLTVAPSKRWAPQIYGRAVLFDDPVWS